MRLFAAAAMISLCLSVPQFATAAIPIVIDGKITGANGINIGGKMYDVRFKDGSCEDVFGTCTNPAFDFLNQEDAETAAAALADQVFLDSEFGLFDSDPGLTAGCTKPEGFIAFACSTYIPFSTLNGSQNLSFSFFQNNAPEYLYQEGFGTATSSVGNLSLARSQVWADFSLSAVPEPATWAVMILGFGAIGASMRKKAAAASALRS